MHQERYGLTVHTDMPTDEAEAAIRAALDEQGFGILTEIDLAATLHKKLGVERPAYKILGACNPTLANRAVDAEQAIGLLLPCNIAVYETADGGTVVAAMEPELMATMTDNPELADVAAEAKRRISLALTSLEQ